jgi:flagella basal body P-ring formation protein FlgA
MARILLLSWLAAFAVAPAVADDAEAVFATRTLRVGALLTAADVELRALPEHRAAGVATRLEDVVGREVKRNLYAGRPVPSSDVGAPTVVVRNTLVTLAYRRGSIELTTLGRALDDAGLHEPVRVVNVDSRLTVVGTVAGPGVVRIGTPGGAVGAHP